MAPGVLLPKYEKGSWIICPSRVSMTCLSLKTKSNSVKSYTVEIVPNNNEKDNNEGLRILARIIARRIQAERNKAFKEEILGDSSYE